MPFRIRVSTKKIDTLCPLPCARSLTFSVQRSHRTARALPAALEKVWRAPQLSRDFNHIMRCCIVISLHGTRLYRKQRAEPRGKVPRSAMRVSRVVRIHTQSNARTVHSSTNICTCAAKSDHAVLRSAVRSSTTLTTIACGWCWCCSWCCRRCCNSFSSFCPPPSGNVPRPIRVSPRP